MKIVILGGGIAGLAFSIIMKRKGHEVVINERCDSTPTMGNAFMLHGDGMEILSKILDNESLKVPGDLINTFILKRPDDREVKYVKMEPWQCMKRVDLVMSLMNVLGEENMRFRRVFSHFIYENGKATAAVFENGDIEYGDMFVGSDGSNSRVRQLLFGETNFTKIEVKEILGIAHHPELCKKYKGVFTKFQSAHNGISLGFMPFSDTEIIWFNQFDVALVDQPLDHAVEFESFTKKTLASFPPVVNELLSATDFNNSYLWNTKDFDTLPSFHSENIILIGDAAHLAVPFTSAGVTNALYDAALLDVCLDQADNNLDIAFNKFYNKRSSAVTEHLELGRKLKHDFLNPIAIDEDYIELPLIKMSLVEKAPPLEKKDIEIIYFTDPICSTCWTIQPQLRKLRSTYGNTIDFKYVMAGLLPSWNNYNRGGIKSPSDVADHWEMESSKSGMPIDGSVWTNDALASSYSPSVAFKAAQMQDIDKAILLLRRMNELIFLEGNNIARFDVLKKAAYDVGLDAARLLRDLNKNALLLFNQDLQLTKEMRINLLPTFIFKVNNEIKDYLIGAQSYETFEQMIFKLNPSIVKRDLKLSPIEVFNKYPSLTKKEFKFLTNTNEEEADIILKDLLIKGAIKELQTKAGFIWISNKEITPRVRA